MTEATYELIRDRFVCEPRGVISVKGEGDMTTYLLVSRNEDAGHHPLDALLKARHRPPHVDIYSRSRRDAKDRGSA